MSLVFWDKVVRDDDVSANWLVLLDGDGDASDACEIWLGGGRPIERGTNKQIKDDQSESL